MLTMMDNRIIKVTLEAVENILKNGELLRIAMGSGAENPYAAIVEEVGGMVAIHNLQTHDNHEIYTISYRIMETYFADEEEDIPVAEDGQFKVCRCDWWRTVADRYPSAPVDGSSSGGLQLWRNVELLRMRERQRRKGGGCAMIYLVY
jgi:hypothetical protein